MNPTLCRTLFAAASLALTGCGGKLIYGEMEEPTLVLTQPLGQTVPPGPPFPVTVPQGLLTFTFSVPDIPLSGGSTTSTQAGFTVGSSMTRATPFAGYEGPGSALLKLGDISFVNNQSDARFALLGGRFVGEAALLRFYVLHCVGLPLVAGFLMAIHFWRIRRDGGISGPL